MRPPFLNPLFASSSGLKGIGSKLDKLLVKLLRHEHNVQNASFSRIIDLLLHVPTGVVDRRHRANTVDLPLAGVVTVEVTVAQHRPPPPHKKNLPYIVGCYDETGPIELVFFHAFEAHLRRLLPEGETRFVSGSVSWYAGTPQIAHPDHVVTADEFAKLPLIEPVYPLTAGVTQKVLARAIRSSLERLPQLAEWQDEAWLRQQGWPCFRDALKELHLPTSTQSVDINSPARTRLAYDELLSNQLALSLVRKHMKKAAGRRLTGTGDLRSRIIAALPYSLTHSQTQAIEDILQDMSASERMLRLLQGDVGSGKTVVALLALATAVEAGTQSVLMAPTEILARQHFATLQPLCAAAGIQLNILTGREKGQTRENILASLATGKAQMVVGTHALFQEDVGFHDLGLVVIDEQHRFGVHQRLALQMKAGAAVDLLVMTATPIPRTLALTVYGDMEVSKLTEKPAGRQPIDTRVLPLERMDEVIEGIARLLPRGARVYWVCPLVEESEAVDLAAAEHRFSALENAFPQKVGLIHGKMSGTERDRAMAAFKAGETSILVSTTVIEVGVDVPEASIIVIENAERFGLAQLHQLRGRVGRGSEKSSCLLLYQPPLGETAKARLSIMRETDDGFRIAEEDLRLRGAGELLGTRQSGLADFRLADLSIHGDLLAAAKDDVTLILEKDPALKTSRGEALRTLLYLFERDEAIKLIAAG